jgi:hypothetical protein
MGRLPVSNGVKVLHDCPNATVDICFVHGLTGNRESIWRPEILLPPELRKARILTYGYDAYTVRTSVAYSNELNEHAKNLLNDLMTDKAFCNAHLVPLFSSPAVWAALSARTQFSSHETNPNVSRRQLF